MSLTHGLPLPATFDGVVVPCAACRGTGRLKSRWFGTLKVGDCPACEARGYFPLVCTSKSQSVRAAKAAARALASSGRFSRPASGSAMDAERVVVRPSCPRFE